MHRSLLSLLREKVVDVSDEVVMYDLNAISQEKYRFWCGLCLAIGSCFFIGASFIIKKKALIRLTNVGIRAGSGGYGYLRDWLWWSGLVSMGLGEALNFAAYALAPASLVTPLGALSVLITAVLASKFLNESLNLLGKLGCVLCIVGSTMIVIHAPTKAEVNSLEQIGAMLTESSFLIYLTFVLMTSLLLIFVYAPKYGNSNLLIYVLICSMIGSLPVMACKGLGLAVRETIAGNGNQLAHGLFWIFLFSVIGSITVQMNYLNKALDVFSTSLVTPVYYVFFTTFVLTASSVLFKEWSSMNAKDVIGSLSGFTTIVIAIFLLNGCKELSITLEDLRKLWNKRKTPKTIAVIDDSLQPLVKPQVRRYKKRRKRNQKLGNDFNIEILESDEMSDLSDNLTNTYNYV